MQAVRLSAEPIPIANLGKLLELDYLLSPLEDAVDLLRINVRRQARTGAFCLDLLSTPSRPASTDLRRRMSLDTKRLRAGS